MKKNNIIPENIIFVYNLNKGENGVYPAFPIQEGNEGRLETAREWASQYVMNENGKRIKSPENVKEEALENKSEFIKSVKLEGIEERGNGGRAWKVIINNKFLIDLRESPLFNSLLLDGCSEGGLLKGEFIFANNGVELRLLNKRSSEFIKIQENKNKVDGFYKLDKNNIGIIWETKKNKYIYLGCVELEINSFEFTLLKEFDIKVIFYEDGRDNQRKKEKILIFVRTWGINEEALSCTFSGLNILKSMVLGKESFKFNKKDLEKKLDVFYNTFKEEWTAYLKRVENIRYGSYRKCFEFFERNNLFEKKEKLMDEIFYQLKKQYAAYE